MRKPQVSEGACVDDQMLYYCENEETFDYIIPCKGAAHYIKI